MAKDITGRGHWDAVYGASPQAVTSAWHPAGYDETCIEHLLLDSIGGRAISNILEVGCGNTTWLPYLAKVTGASVTGIDYSPGGCDLARRNLKAAGVEGTIVCGDLFTIDPGQLGQFDFVYSLGLVEHFDCLEDVLGVIYRFTAPGGVLLTEVPNLASLHGVLAYFYQPCLLAKHRVVTVSQLARAYSALGLKRVQSGHLGIFSVGVVAWGVDQRYPRLDFVILPLVRLASRVINRVTSVLATCTGIPLLAPFAFAAGEREAPVR